MALDEPANHRVVCGAMAANKHYGCVQQCFSVRVIQWFEVFPGPHREGGSAVFSIINFINT